MIYHIITIIHIIIQEEDIVDVDGVNININHQIVDIYKDNIVFEIYLSYNKDDYNS
jgi:hypothetical protein